MEVGKDLPAQKSLSALFLLRVLPFVRFAAHFPEFHIRKPTSTGEEPN